MAGSRLPVPRTFTFQTTEVRCCGTDRDLWFVAKDVCESLKIAWDSHALRHVPEDWRRVASFTTPRRNPDGTNGFQKQDMVVISEKAVYKLAFRSNEASALAFTDWVAGEVIPAIRKTGEYRTKQRQRYKGQGKLLDWIEEREEGIEERKTFTATLQAHDCDQFGNATNSVYRPLLGGSAAHVRMSLHLKPKANVRDHISTHDLAKVKFAEMMAADKIETENLNGNGKCLQATSLAANAVAHALRMVRETKIA